MHGVGQVARLEAQAGVLAVDDPTLAAKRSVQIHARVKHDRRGGGVYFHHPSRLRVVDGGRVRARAARAVEQIGQVVAALLTSADCRRFGEVQRRALDRRNLAGWRQVLAQRRVAVGVDPQHVPQHVARACPGQVEVAVVRQAHRRGSVGGGDEVDGQLTAVGERKKGRRPERAGVALIAVRADVSEPHGRTVRRFDRLGRPDDFAKPFGAAVQVVGPVVERELIRFAVELEAALGDPEGHPAGHAAEVGALGLVRLEFIEPQHDVVQTTVAVGHVQLGDRRPVGDQPHHACARAAERVTIDRGAVGRGAEGFFFDADLVHHRPSARRRLTSRGTVPSHPSTPGMYTMANEVWIG